jgi:hypothetical protein
MDWRCPRFDHAPASAEADWVDQLRWGIDMYEERLAELREKGVTDAKRAERKDYVKGVLSENRWFVHCSTVSPALVRASGGLDPEKSAELCFLPGGTLIGKTRGRLVLAFGCEDHTAPVAAGAIKAQGYLGQVDVATNVYGSGYLYVFSLAQGSHYYSPCKDELGPRSETAFDYKIPLNRMKCFNQYNKQNNTCVLLHDWTT